MDIQDANGEVLVQVVENQRHWGVMWGPPIIPGLDWPPWSDASGTPVALLRPPTIDGQGGWFVVRTASTDEDGWLYGTHFERLSLPRPGGRASKRANDQVRSRVWRRLNADQELQPLQAERLAAGVAAAAAEASPVHHGHGAPPHPPAAAPPAAAEAPRRGPAKGQPPPQRQVSVSREAVSGSQILSALTTSIIYKQLPKPSVFRIWQALMELWNESAKRHGVLKVIPLDPVGLYIAIKAHAAAAAAVRRDSLVNDRLLLSGVCAANTPPAAPPTPAAGAAPSPKAGGEGSSSSARGPLASPASSSAWSFTSWAAAVPGMSDMIAKGPMAGLVMAGPAPASPAPHQQQRGATGAPQADGSASWAPPAWLGLPFGGGGSGSGNGAATAAANAGSSGQQAAGLSAGVAGPGTPGRKAASDSTGRAGPQASHGHLPPHHHHGPAGATAGGVPVAGHAAGGGVPSPPYAAPRHPRRPGGAVAVAPAPASAAPTSTLQIRALQQQAQPPGSPSRHLAPGGASGAAAGADAPSSSQNAQPAAAAAAGGGESAPKRQSGGAWRWPWRGSGGGGGNGGGPQGGAAAAAAEQGRADVAMRKPSSGGGAGERPGGKDGAPRRRRGGRREGAPKGSRGGRGLALLPDMHNPAAVVQELLTIVNYTRAAYGYVMAAGHMANISTMLHMVGTSAFFNPVTGASMEANTQAIHTLTGIPQSDVLLAEWRNHVFRPCHYLAVDRAHGRLVLCVRGSLELGDICTDLAAQPADYTFGGGLGACQVHHGLIAAALYVEESTRAALDAAAEQYATWPLLVTGHSLGGGVAALLAIMLKHGHGERTAPSPWADRVYCVAVAGPPAVSKHVAEKCSGFIVSLVHNMDFVPRLSHYSVELALMEMVRSSPAAQLADNLSATLAAVTQALPWAAPAAATTSAAIEDDDGGGAEGEGAAGAAAGQPGAAAAEERVPEHSLDPELAADLLASAPVKPLEVELMTQRSPFTAAMHRRKPSAAAPPPQPSSQPGIELAALAPPAQLPPPLERASAPDGAARRAADDEEGGAAATSAAFASPSWAGSLLALWGPSQRSSEEGDGSGAASGAEDHDAPPGPSAAPAGPASARSMAGAGAPGGAAAAASHVLQQQGRRPQASQALESSDPSDHLMDCWSDLVEVVKHEAQAAVDAVNTTLRDKSGVGGTLGATMAAGAGAAAAAGRAREGVPRGGAAAAVDAPEWVVVSSGGQAPGAGGAERGPLGAAGTAAAAAAPMQGLGPPPPLGDVMKQVVEDVEAAVEHTQQEKLHRQQQEGGAGGGGVEPSGGSVSAAGSVEVSKEEVAEQLECTKLHLPGRVLWVMLEEHSVVRQVLLQQQDQLTQQQQPAPAGAESPHAPAPAAAAPPQQVGKQAAPAAPGPAGAPAPAPAPAQPQAPAQLHLASATKKRRQEQQQLLDLALLQDFVPGGAVDLARRSSASHASAAASPLGGGGGAEGPSPRGGGGGLDGLVVSPPGHAVTAGAGPGVGKGGLASPRAPLAARAAPTLLASGGSSFLQVVAGEPRGGGGGVAEEQQQVGVVELQRRGGSHADGGAGAAEDGEEEGDASSLAQRFKQGFQQLRSTIEQAIGKAAALEQRQGNGGNGGGGASGGALLAAGGGPQMVCLIEARRELFEELSLVPSCASDHIPDSYYNTLKQLYAAILTGRVYVPVAAVQRPKQRGRRRRQPPGAAGGAGEPGWALCDKSGSEEEDEEEGDEDEEDEEDEEEEPWAAGHAALVGELPETLRADTLVAARQQDQQERDWVDAGRPAAQSPPAVVWRMGLEGGVGGVGVGGSRAAGPRNALLDLWRLT